MKTPRMLILLASDKLCRLIAAEAGRFTEIASHSAADFPDVDVEFTSPPPRGQSPAGTASFTIDPRQSEAEQERGRFAAHVIAALESQWAKGGHDRIVIAAGPKMLGVLRDRLPKALAAQVMADMDKDLVKIPVHEMSPHFAEVFAP
ncbi:protein required for attachment to host cells [Cereibacter ovatus]|uniref:Protein required for attachment to host cells n=1 Tax=Cereibacter ovatus TaxID=439529 RepID=A0A285D4A2_9RHOB|nr:host attachment protein [Cereibacter ovatus]SNX74622.1 protein required for attachment to host cells [Cereibacter ovatus]